MATSAYTGARNGAAAGASAADPAPLPPPATTCRDNASSPGPFTATVVVDWMPAGRKAWARLRVSCRLLRAWTTAGCSSDTAKCAGSVTATAPRAGGFNASIATRSAAIAAVSAAGGLPLSFANWLTQLSGSVCVPM